MDTRRPLGSNQLLCGGLRSWCTVVWLFLALEIAGAGLWSVSLCQVGKYAARWAALGPCTCPPKSPLPNPPPHPHLHRLPAPCSPHPFSQLAQANQSLRLPISALFLKNCKALLNTNGLSLVLSSVMDGNGPEDALALTRGWALAVLSGEGNEVRLQIHNTKQKEAIRWASQSKAGLVLDAKQIKLCADALWQWPVMIVDVEEEEQVQGASCCAVLGRVFMFFFYVDSGWAGVGQSCLIGISSAGVLGVLGAWESSSCGRVQLGTRMATA